MPTGAIQLSRIVDKAREGGEPKDISKTIWDAKETAGHGSLGDFRKSCLGGRGTGNTTISCASCVESQHRDKNNRCAALLSGRVFLDSRVYAIVYFYCDSRFVGIVSRFPYIVRIYAQPSR